MIFNISIMLKERDLELIYIQKYTLFFFFLTIIYSFISHYDMSRSYYYGK
jgi:hypothetical protein